MKRLLHPLRDWAIALLVLFAVLIVLAFAICARALYETVMLIPRVIHAERRGPLRAPDIEPDMLCQTYGIAPMGYEAAPESWAEHLVREDIDPVPWPPRDRLYEAKFVPPTEPWPGQAGYRPAADGAHHV